MATGVRINSPRNFRGELYATEEYVKDTIKETVALPEGVDSLIDPETGKLNESLNPGITIQMKGETVETNATKVNFIGNCMVVTDGNGFITARIGDNLNSSNFNTKDGQTDGTVSKKITTETGYNATTTATPASDYPTNGGTTVWKDGKYDKEAKTGSQNQLKITTAGKIHFDSTSTKFELDVITGKSGSVRKIFTFGPISASGDFSAYKVTRTVTQGDDGKDIVSDTVATVATEGVSLNISNFKAESKSTEGATGYEGNVTFTVNVQDLISENTDFKFEVRHINGAEGTKSWSADSYIFWIEDTATKPAIGTVDYTITGTSKKQISGVSFLTAGTVNITATGIVNLANPASVSGKLVSSAVNGSTDSTWMGTVEQSGTTGLTGFTGKSTDSVSYSGSGSLNATGQFNEAKVKIYGKNVNGSGASVTSTTSTALLVDKTSKTAATALKEYFASETAGSYPRRKNDCKTNWVSSWSLASNIVDGVEQNDGAEGLQILNGQLRYPTGNYTGTNNGFNSIVGSDQPDYSALTGDRSYVRYFAKTGSLNGGTFTISHDASISSFITAGTLNIEVSKDGSKWYDIARLSGIGTAFTWGTTSSNITFVFTDGVATNGMWFRIRMASSSVTAKINSIVMA